MVKLYITFKSFLIVNLSINCLEVYMRPLGDNNAGVQNIQKRGSSEVDNARAGPTDVLAQIPGMQNLGQLQQGFSTLMNTMKDGKMVMGGFSFVVVPAPDMQQLQGLSGLTGLPSLPSLPTGGT